MIDLRSDTVTKPTDGMRKAMAEAEVGDDVYQEDPTVRRLEELAAALLERPAALFVPTGTMGNQVAVHLSTRPGSEVILEARAHLFNFEMGAMAVWSGALPRPLVTPDGLLTPSQVEEAINPPVTYRTPTRLLCLENTHNLWSGLPMDTARTAALAAVAHRHGLKVHLDGARLFNAAAALDCPPAVLAAPCDSVMFCLSKGLCAPVGSMLCGSADFIYEARRARKVLGGGMRQVGILAAAGIVALEQMTERLAEDHARARRLAERLAEIPGVRVGPVYTNIFYFWLNDEVSISPEDFVARLKSQGVLVLGREDGRYRVVTHYWITDEDVETTIRAVRTVISGQ